MAVLVEAISVIVQRSTIEDKYPGGWETFVSDAPNATLCADGHLVRLGFMTPADVKDYVSSLDGHGIKYIEDEKAQEVVVVDEIRGPAVACSWLEFGHVNLGEDSSRRVSVCRWRGDSENQLATPLNWVYDRSLSRSWGFVPTGQEHKSLTFIQRRGGSDVYLDQVTGREVFVGRTAVQGPRSTTPNGSDPE